MSMADDMRDICQDIVNARAERVERVSEIRKDTGRMINDFSNERKRMGNELRDDLRRHTAGIKKEVKGKLKEFRNDREEMAAELRDELAKALDEPRKAVKAIKKETKDTVAGFGAERKKMGKELKSELRAYTNYITTDVDGLIKDFQSARKNTVREIKDMHSAWGGLSKTKPSKRIIIRGKTMDPETKILETLDAYPLGLTLPELGGKIGVNWRTLIRPASALVKEKRVKKKKAKYLLK